MPLQSNLIERQLIRRGMLPWPLLDVAVPTFQCGAMLAAAELGVFEELADGAVPVEDLVRRTGASQRGLEVLLQVLEGLGYVEAGDAGLRLSKAAKRSVPVELMGDMVPFLRDQIVGGAERSVRAVREAPEDGVFGWERVQSGPVGEAYQVTMRWLASGTVDEVVKKVDLPDGCQRFLDVGGAHGLYTVAFCRKVPGLRGTVLDWPIGLESARQTLEETPDVAARIDLVERDFEREELPQGYDAALLGNIVHGIDPDGNRKLFDKLARATTERGTVIIIDQLAGVSGSKLSRAIAALVGFNLFLWSGGRAYPFDELSSWLAEAGFTEVDRKPLRQSPGFSLVTARKGG